jgi:hypothetical protein
VDNDVRAQAQSSRIALEMARAGLAAEAKELAGNAVAVALTPTPHRAFRELD